MNTYRKEIAAEQDAEIETKIRQKLKFYEPT
jgi:hypothetical protein